MEGPGVTNYSVDKPSYGYTTATTQFDDALLQHGVVDRTQTIVAKGATVARAQELLHAQAMARESQANTVVKRWDETSDDDDDDDDDLLDDHDDDEILQRYRQLRLEELQGEDKSRGIVESISRNEWTTKVNEASRDGTRVVICLTTADARHEFLDACTVLARRHRGCLFVSLPAREALSADWPHPEPSILVYRHGSLCYEFFRLTALSVEDLETALHEVWEGE